MATNNLVTCMTFDSENPLNYTQLSDELLTVQDQSITVRDMIERFTVNRDIPERESYYNDAEMPDPRKMDLVDLYSWRDAIASDIEHNKADLKGLIDEHRIAENGLKERKRELEREALLQDIRNREKQDK